MDHSAIRIPCESRNSSAQLHLNSNRLQSFLTERLDFLSRSSTHEKNYGEYYIFASFTDLYR
jgi:hypothetical protein